MDFSGMKNYEFFISLGYVTIVASLLTMIFTQIIKIILKKRGAIKDEMDANEKDAILSKIGRMVALIVYAFLYIGNELLLKNKIIFDGALIAGLFSGATLTLTLSKGFYTMIRQYQKRKTIFDKLKYAEEVIKKLNEKISYDNTTDIDTKLEVINNFVPKEKKSIILKKNK